MSRIWYLAYALGAAAIFASITGDLWEDALSTFDQWDLTMEYQGEAYVLDSFLLIGDCYEALPTNQTDKHLSFSCDRA